jgi:hypothetical protein
VDSDPLGYVDPSGLGRDKPNNSNVPARAPGRGINSPTSNFGNGYAREIPFIGGGAKIPASVRARACDACQAKIAPADAIRIQNAANRTEQTIVVIGSRASGKSNPLSDWDYILTGKSRQRQSATSSLPRGVWGGANNSGIDIFQCYNPNAPGYALLNPDQPFLIFDPLPK